MAVVSDIEIRLRADIARLQQDMDRARQSVGGAMDRISSMARGAGAALGGLAAALGVGMFAGFIKSAIDAQDAVSDISQRTGVAIKDIAGLQLWFQKGGAEAGDFESSMIKLARTISTGEKEFAKIGVATRDANGDLRSSVAVLLDSGDAFAKMQDGAAKTALAIELFGKSGATLIPILNSGSQGLRDMTEMADKLGLTFDQKVVDQAGDFNDTLDFLGLAAQGVGRKVAGELLPTLQSMAGSFLKLVVEGDGVSKMAQGIATGFKILYTSGVSIVALFSAVGKAIGGTVAFVTNNLSTLFTALRQGIEGDYAKAWQTIQSGGQQAGTILTTTFSDVKRDLSAAATSISEVWTGAGGETVAALSGMQKKVKSTSEEAAKDAKKQADAYAALRVAAQELVAATGREAAGMAPLNAAQKLTADLDVAIKEGKIKLTAEREATLRGLYAEAEANLAAVESQKAYAKMLEGAGKLEKELADSRASSIKSATEEAEKNEQLAKTFGMTAAQVEALELARLREQLASRVTVGMTLDEIEHLEQLIALKERSAAAVADRGAMETTKQFWTDVEKTAHDTFVSIADGGKGAFERLKDSAKNIFFEWLYQQTLKKWIINIQANTSTSGGSDLLSMFSGSGGGGGTGNIGSLISMGKTIYSGFAGGMASSMGGYISAAGNMFGSTAASAFGAGMSSPATAGVIAELSSGAAGSAAGGATAGGSAAAGASAGAYAIPIAGWIAAGMALSKNLYKSGWQADNDSMNTMGNVVSSGSKILDSALRGIGLSKSTANMFSGMSTYVRLFGRKNPEITAQGIEGTFGAGGFTGQTYADILEKGGVFRSDKRYTKTAALATEQEKAFDSTMQGMIAAAKGFGDAIGAQSDVIDSYSKQIKLTLTQDQAANEKMITETFAVIGDELATFLLPAIESFAQEGETAAATLQRVAMNFQVVTAVLSTLGTDSARAFGATGMDTLGARERLVALSGGLDAFGAQVDFFTQNFLTRAEQIEPLQKQVNEQLARLGYAGITTADQFKGAVLELTKSGALATEEGAKTYAGLMAIGPAFKSVADYLAESAASLSNLGRDQVQARVDAALAVLGRAVDTQRDIVTTAYASAMSAIEKHLDSVNTTVARATQLSTALRNSLRTVETADQHIGARNVAGAQIAAALAIAKASGVLPSADDLRDALGTLARDSSDQFSTLADYQRATAQMNAQLQALGGLSDEQLSTAERQIQLLEQQKELAETANTAEMARLDGLVAHAQAQVDAINKVDTSVVSLGGALGAVYQAIRDLQGVAGTSPYYYREGGKDFDVPMVASYPQSDTLAGGGALAVFERIEQQLAALAASGARTAIESARTAEILNNVTAGGNAMLTENA